MKAEENDKTLKKKKDFLNNVIFSIHDSFIQCKFVKKRLNTNFINRYRSLESQVIFNNRILKPTCQSCVTIEIA